MASLPYKIAIVMTAHRKVSAGVRFLGAPQSKRPGEDTSMIN
jgi:hypothetical protein